MNLSSNSLSYSSFFSSDSKLCKILSKSSLPPVDWSKSSTYYFKLSKFFLLFYTNINHKLYTFIITYYLSASVGVELYRSISSSLSDVSFSEADLRDSSKVLA